MFEKTKAQIEKFQEDHENVRKAVQHVKDNKNFYIAAPAIFGAGYLLRANPDMKQVLKTHPRISGLAYKSTQVINNTVVQEMVRQGEPGKKTFWVEKGIWFPSRNAAAKAAGISFTSVQKCCDGVIDSVKGQHFVDGGDMI